MKTTLNQIRAYTPCETGWKKLLLSLSKTKADDEPITITRILDSNGLDDALWCLRAVKGYEREKRIYAVKQARRVQHLMTDQRSLDALDMAEKFANGEKNQKDLCAAWAAAWAAARAASGAAAWAAAWAASGAAARAASGDAAWAAAWATRDAVWAAARHAAGDAAGAAAGELQEQDLRDMCEACK